MKHIFIKNYNIILKKISLTILFFLNFNLFYSQEIKENNISAVNSPEVSNFISHNFLGLNEYTGKAKIEIPIYTLKIDGKEIPISLTYDTGGVKVNTIASTVGLNWSLNAGGVIYREIKGSSDYQQSIVNHEPTGWARSSYGFLRHLFSFPTVPLNPNGTPIYSGYMPIIEKTKDFQPDIYNVVALGLNTSFFHNNQGQPIETSGVINKIKTPFTDSYFLTEPFGHPSSSNGGIKKEYGLNKIKEDSKFKFGFEFETPDGLKYDFYDKHYSMNLKRQYDKSLFDIQLISDPSSIRLNLEFQAPFLQNNDELIDYFRYLRVYAYPSVTQWPNVNNYACIDVIKLSKIESKLSKNKIKFNYLDNLIIDNHKRLDVTFRLLTDNYYDTKSVNDFEIEKNLSSIEFDEGKINFIYSNNREDVNGGIILKKIEIRDKKGNLIKGMSLEHSYFQPDINCNDSKYCKRLKLNEIFYYDKDNNKLSGFKFEYNEGVALPKRYSYTTDFLGFYNGPNNISNLNSRPKVYYKQGEGKFSFIPFAFNGYQLYGNGNISKEANLQYCLAGSLKKITYPTGGFCELEYELNNFTFKNQNVNLGGLRIKNQKINDGINNEIINYNYNLSNGLSSGQIHNLPNFISKSLISSTISQENINHLMINTESSYVGYSEVKVSKLNLGYEIKTFSNIETNLNVLGTESSIDDVSPINSTYLDYYNLKKENGLIPNIYINNIKKRGNLLNHKIYNQNNNLIEETINEYEYQKYNDFEIKEYIYITGRNFTYSLSGGATALYTSKYEIGNNLLKSKIRKSYSTSGVIENKTIYDYYSSIPFNKFVTQIGSNGIENKKEFIYSFDPSVSASPFINTLNNQNIFKIVKEISFHNNIKISELFYEFKNHNNNIVEDKLYYSKTPNQPILKEEFLTYDKKNNVVEYRINGKENVNIYGYNYLHKIAEIEGISLSQVLSNLNFNSLDDFQNKTESELNVAFNQLRDSFPNAFVKNFTYKPLVGVDNITDINKNKTKYDYDGFNRLITIKDESNNEVLKNYNYSYENVVNTAIFTAPLTCEVIKHKPDDFVPYQSNSIYKVILKANVSGGKGKYIYNWYQNNVLISQNDEITVNIPCNSSTIIIFTINDDIDTITKTFTVNAPKCNEPFYVPNQMQGYSNVNSQNKHWIDINDIEGGSFKYRFQWKYGSNNYRTDLMKLSNETNEFKLLTPITFTTTLFIKITDVETGHFVERSKQVTFYKEFTPISCFVAGTKILMSDNKYKNIEDVKIGEEIITYNTEKKILEKGKVEELEQPFHNNLVKIKLENGKFNQNTHDHPFYVKGKGWCSYNPSLTLSNYKLKVNKLDINDLIFYHNKNNEIEYLKIISIKPFVEGQRTYNLKRVSKNHNFFANNMLVHNKSNE